MGWSQGLEQVFLGLVSPCDPRGRLTPPCSPTADQGPWAQARFGPPVSGAQPGSEAAEQGAWGRLEKPSLRCAPFGARVLGRASGRRRVRALGPCCYGPLCWSPEFQQRWPGVTVMVQPVYVVKGRLSVAVVAVLHKCTFLKNKLVIHSE